MPALRDDADDEIDELDDDLDEDLDDEDDLDDLEDLNGEAFDDDLDDLDDEEDDAMNTASEGTALPADRKPARTRGGARTDDDMAADRLEKDKAEGVDPHQEDLLDEGVEETFPASDPVSVKRIT